MTNQDDYNGKASLLIVDDDLAGLRTLSSVLVEEGFEIRGAPDGPTALMIAEADPPDLIFLDIQMPGMDGFEICNRIRENDREQPIIMLTAKTSDDDIIHGLSLGADDYVAKPFSVAQLVLRIQAVLRRAKVTAEQENRIQLDANTYVDTQNLNGRRKENDLSFTRREIEILQYLKAHQERPVPREELLTKIWGYAKDLDIETRTVDIHIAKLRRKIEHESSNPAFLVTVRGAGYRLMTQ